MLHMHIGDMSTKLPVEMDLSAFTWGRRQRKTGRPRSCEVRRCVLECPAQSREGKLSNRLEVRLTFESVVWARGTSLSLNEFQ